MYYNKDLYVDVIGTFGHIRYDENRTTGFSIVPGSTVTLHPTSVKQRGMFHFMPKSRATTWWVWG